ncbi:MAG: competence/damage-inducible protein A [Clostridia bacterium]|nr:competence/damage-inducible protein A [Clostridia bacterium]
MTAEIICVGTELLLGDIVNTNAPFISRHLARLGIAQYHQSVVGDNHARFKELFAQAYERADIIITSGGLGPTYDDMTKEAICDFLRCKTVVNDESLSRMQEFFKLRGREMTHNNIKQAVVPEGAEVFQNDNGTAPGICVEKNGKYVIMLPGPPRELEPMFEFQVIPYLFMQPMFDDSAILSHNIRIFGIGESAVEDKLYELMTQNVNPSVAPYAKSGEVLLRVTARAETPLEAEEMMKPVINRIKECLGEYIYGIDVDSLQEVLVEKLAEKGLKIATAESCTGGLVSKRITEIPGSSAVFDCGICSYANEIKNKVLGVENEDLKKYGAVSDTVALQMAQGVLKLSGADVAVSTTGIAGPGGGTPEKPCGTVYIAAVTKNKQIVRRFMLSRGTGDERENIRHLSTMNALSMALEIIKEI